MYRFDWEVLCKRKNKLNLEIIKELLTGQKEFKYSKKSKKIVKIK